MTENFDNDAELDNVIHETVNNLHSNDIRDNFQHDITPNVSHETSDFIKPNSEIVTNGSVDEIPRGEVTEMMLSPEEHEAMFSHVDGSQIINDQVTSLAEVVVNSIERGDISGVTTQDLEKPGFMSSFLETSTGKKVMNTFRALAVATAFVTPMKDANAGVGDVLRGVVNQEIQTEGQIARAGMQTEGRFQGNQIQLESRLQNQKIQMESRFRAQLAERNARDRAELIQFDTKVQGQMEQLNMNPSISQAQKNQQLSKFMSDRAQIEAKQEASYTIWATGTVPAEREKFEVNAEAQRARFAANVQVKRGNLDVYAESQRNRVITNAVGQFGQELFRHR